MPLIDAVVDEAEALVDEGVAVLGEVMADVVAALGERPYGFARVPAERFLDWWVSVRDSPEAIGQLIADEAVFWGPSLALRRVLREAIQTEAQLARAGGAEAVQSAALMRRLGESEKALRRLDQHEALPPFVVAPPARVLSQAEMLGWSTGADVGVGMEPLGAASLAPELPGAGAAHGGGVDG